MTLIRVFIILVLLTNVVWGAEPCPATCQPPSCVCPSTSAPGNLPADATPQFVVLYTDELMTKSMLAQIVDLTSKHQNDNGCDIPITWYIRDHSNPDMIRNAFNRYFEIGVTAAAEGGDVQMQIDKAKAWLVAKAKIPENCIVGFRAPKWSNGIGARSMLKSSGFLYDHSIREVDPDPGLREWPYTMDFGITQSCSAEGIMCDDRERHAGLFEVPVWELRNRHNQTDKVTKHASPGEALFANPDWATLLAYNFAASYYGNRAPIAIPLSSKRLLDNVGMMEGLSHFIGKILEFDNVWVVTNAQLIAYMQSPEDNRHVHDLLECGSRSSDDSDCFPPDVGCARGTYDYTDCTCQCENFDNRNLPGFCVDSYGRCTAETIFNPDTKLYFCQPPEVIPEAELLVHGLGASAWLIMLYVVLSILAAIGLWRAFVIGRRRARMLHEERFDDYDDF